MLLAVGCGDSKRAAVNGTVLVDGKPLETGSINFFPAEDTTGPTAGARVDNGKYSIAQQNGVVVGKNKVEIRGLRKTGRKIRDPRLGDREMDEMEVIIPPEYNVESKMVKTISPGTNTLDFELHGIRKGR
jgi:hypothetical protein